MASSWSERPATTLNRFISAKFFRTLTGKIKSAIFIAIGLFNISKMWGFGALRAFNDTIKLNRELLKAQKKNPFDRKSFQTFRKKRTSFGDHKLTESERAELIEQVKQEAWRERLRSILVLLFSLIIALLIIRGIIHLVLYYMS